MERRRVALGRPGGVVLSLAFCCFWASAARAQLAAHHVGTPLTADERAAAYAELDREVADLQQRGGLLKRVVRLVAPTVVHIDTTKTDGFSRRSGIDEAGSGVIVEFSGQRFVLTNWHVVRGARNENIKVRLFDGQVLSPSRVLHDDPTDLALLAVPSDRLIAARLGDSSSLDIGDFVAAVGSPFGLSHSVTYGIVSAKGRRDLQLGDDGVEFQDFIQTDAAINPGNSGGPLVNLRGEVVGVNTAIASNSGGNEGIGFSIPINMVVRVVQQLVSTGEVRRGFLGVKMADPFAFEKATELGLSIPRGALITQILEGTPAEAAGLRADDVILEFDGVEIEDDAHLQNVVSLTAVGKSVPIVVLREEQQIELQVELARRQPSPRQSRRDGGSGDVQRMGLSGIDAWDIDILGITLVRIDDDVIERFHLPHNAQGLFVARVVEGGPSDEKVRVGDIVDRILKKPVRTIDDLEQVLGAAELDGGIELELVRDGNGSAWSSARQTVRVTPDLRLLP